MDLFLSVSSSVLFFLIFNYKWYHMILVFSIWLLTMISWSSHTTANDRISFSYVWVIFRYMYVPPLFLCSSVDGYLGYFHVLEPLLFPSSIALLLSKLRWHRVAQLRACRRFPSSPFSPDSLRASPHRGDSWDPEDADWGQCNLRPLSSSEALHTWNSYQPFILCFETHFNVVDAVVRCH